MSPIAVAPPLTPLPAGKTLIPQIIDFRAEHDPDRVCISYPSPGQKIADTHITYRDFALAVDAAAHVLAASPIGRRFESNEATRTVGILARSGPAYMVTVYALHKCGIVPVLISPRNSRAAIVNLLKLTQCTALISDEANSVEAKGSTADLVAQGGSTMPLIDLAPLPMPQFGAAASVTPFKFELDVTEEYHRPVVYLHTSGSTGLPKPVAWTNSFVFHQGYYPADMIDRHNGVSVLATLPLFHGSGLALTRASLLWLGWRLTFTDSGKPITASDIVSICQSNSAPDVVIGAPSVIEEIASLEGGWDVLHGRKFWFFVGAPVPPHFGSLLVQQGVHFLSMLGSTEIGQMNVLEPEGRQREDWQYHQLRPDLDIVLEPRGSGSDGAPYELIILSKAGWRPGTINVNVNGIDGYSTSDLYHKHPTDARFYKHAGRADDVIVLANGEKTLSRPIEVPVEAHPAVKAAVVFGTGRSQNGILVWPANGRLVDPESDVSVADFRNEIWSAVEKANQTSPSHSQIWKEMILITTPGKDLPLTDKGSVRRKPAIQLYQEEIDRLYVTIEEFSAAEGDNSFPAEHDQSSLALYFTTLCRLALGKEISEDDDVFSAGMDSLKSIYVRNSLLSALRRDSDPALADSSASIPQNFVFTYTTPAEMGRALLSLIKTGRLEDSAGVDSQHAESILQTIERYTKDFPKHAPILDTSAESKHTVVLTGSTGSLGSFILESLMRSPEVARVICFNRRGQSASFVRQTASFSERGLDTRALSEAAGNGRVVFYDVNLTETHFGLAKETYETIQSQVTLLVHNAWALNFNWQLQTFESIHIAGLRALVDFALTSPRSQPPRLAFSSSIASVGAYTGGPVPEVSIEDPKVCLMQGYARSKFVAERILAVAAESTPLQTLSFRIGQISGDSPNGIWNESDHVPVTLRGCQDINAIPQDWLPIVSWTPVDAVAKTIVDIVLNSKDGNGTFHVANPRPTPWKQLLPFVRRSISSNTEMETIPFAEWIERLVKSGASPEDSPAMKLIAFFENNHAGKGIRCRLDLERTLALSKSLSQLPQYGEDAMGKSIAYWKQRGFLHSQ